MFQAMFRMMFLPSLRPLLIEDCNTLIFLAFSNSFFSLLHLLAKMRAYVLNPKDSLFYIFVDLLTLLFFRRLWLLEILAF